MVIGELRPPQPPCPGTLACCAWVPVSLYVCNIPCRSGWKTDLTSLEVKFGGEIIRGESCCD